MQKKILFIHNNFPGQFPHVAAAAQQAGYKVAVVGSATAKEPLGAKVERWKLKRGTTNGIFPPATRAEADLLRADAAAAAARRLKDDGFVPDLIIGHPGWGETIYMSTIFPGVPQLLFGELYYRAHGFDVGFDPEFDKVTPEQELRVHAKNATQALAYTDATTIVCPTPFQASSFPETLQSRIIILHEGVDLTTAVRQKTPCLKLPNGQTLDGTKPVITFINRNFERLRGFHIFMRALPALMLECPDAQVVIIGKDGLGGYGGNLDGQQTWKEQMMGEIGDQIDQSRLHFLGRVTHADMITALSLSTAHVYYTYPFVLSWSLVEAMACECLILGSDTKPVRDAITHNQNGLLFDFFDVDALSKAMIVACQAPERYLDLRKNARQTALTVFDKDRVGVPGWMALISETLNRPA
jgi:glycosyltransferase involved in cell wall biosynthesis